MFGVYLIMILVKNKENLAFKDQSTNSRLFRKGHEMDSRSNE